MCLCVSVCVCLCGKLLWQSCQLALNVWVWISYGSTAIANIVCAIVSHTTMCLENKLCHHSIINKTQIQTWGIRFSGLYNWFKNLSCDSTDFNDYRANELDSIWEMFLRCELKAYNYFIRAPISHLNFPLVFSTAFFSTKMLFSFMRFSIQKKVKNHILFHLVNRSKRQLEPEGEQQLDWNEQMKIYSLCTNGTHFENERGYSSAKLRGCEHTCILRHAHIYQRYIVYAYTECCNV